jgi:hypothetical protein
MVSIEVNVGPGGNLQMPIAMISATTSPASEVYLAGRRITPSCSSTTRTSRHADDEREKQFVSRPRQARRYCA